MTRLRGVDHEAGRALFETDGYFVVVDTNKKDVVQVETDLEAVTASAWLKVGTTLEYPDVWRELADAAVTTLGVQEEEVASAERTYRIPNAVKVEAQQALDWVSGFDRGKSVIGAQFAGKLLAEKDLTAADIARLDRYFGRISKRSLSAGWEPGQQGYPTDERIRFAMRGGEAARAWVSKIVARHGITAAGEPDGNKPHEYQDDPEIPGSCVICGRDATASIHTGIVAGAFEYDPTCEYFGVGVNPDETLVTGLLMLRTDGTWQIREDNDWAPTNEPGPEDVIILLDEDSAYRLAEILDDIAPGDPSVLPFELATLNPHEAALAALALEEDGEWEEVDRVMEAFDIYDSTERSVNAKKQNRAPGGRFGETPDDPAAADGSGQQGQVKARLPEGMPLVPDVAARIQEYLAANGGADAAAPVETATGLSAQYLNSLIETYADTVVDDGAAPAQPATDTSAARPLYLALVDKVDTEAVLDLVSLMPGNPPVMWKRDGGAWVQAPDILAALQGSAPPPVVELTDDAVVADVIKQVDDSTGGETEQPDAAPTPGATPQGPDGATGPKPDANPDQQRRAASNFSHPELDMLRTWASAAEKEKYAGKGYALPDGSFPIPDVNHLKKAIKAHGRAKDKAKAKRHIMKRARALKRADLIPDDWKANSIVELTMFGPNGELLDLTEFAGGLDKNRGNAEELRKYWTRGKGGLKIRWNTPGDMTRCMRQLRKYLGGREAGYCALRHREMTGRWPGERDKDGNL